MALESAWREEPDIVVIEDDIETEDRVIDLDDLLDGHGLEEDSEDSDDITAEGD